MGEPIRTLQQFMVKTTEPLAFLYRGVARSSYELIPSLARGFSADTGPLSSVEDRLLSEFKRRALPWLTTFLPRSDLDWEWMILAQHHGVPTRLLDWTENPFVALFFACGSDVETHGCVHVLTNSVHELPTDCVKNRYDLQETYYIRPPCMSPRLLAQSSFFTVGRDPLQPVPEHLLLPAIEIHKDFKEPLRRELARYGISSASLFPGLDGLGTDLKTWLADRNSDFTNPQST